MHMYCEFEDTHTLYNDKKIYSCIYCGIKLLLEDPNNAKILCFAKRDELNRLIDPTKKSINGLDDSNIQQSAIKMALEKNSDQSVNMNSIDSMVQSIKDKKENNLCSEEQINSRLEICKSCEYYKDNSCMLCGCVIVRESNYTNKLAHKDQHCPIMKWKQIVD